MLDTHNVRPGSPSRRHGFSSRWVPALLVMFLGLLVILLGPQLVRQIIHEREREVVLKASSRLVEDNILELINQASRNIALKVEPSVVHVSTSGNLRGSTGQRGFFTSSGSGWVYDVQGHVITNAHVVASADVIEIQFQNGERRSARFIGSDVRSDIAVLRVDPVRMHPAERSIETPEQGELVYAFGSPFDFRFSMSSGIVSGLGRSAGLAALDTENFIQIDAAVNPGNSGGPLCDVQGRVIGMNTAIATGRGNQIGEEGQFAGIALAIPTRMIELIVDQIIAGEEIVKGYLGVQMVSIAPPVPAPTRLNSNLREVYDSFEGVGVLVTDVPSDGPAAQAGVMRGDVILSIDDIAVTEVDNVAAQVGFRLPGSTIMLQLWRWDRKSQESRRLTIDVTLGTMNPGVIYRESVRFLQLLGLSELATLTPALAAERGIPWVPGVLVLASASGSAIQAGEVIRSVSNESISSLEDLYTRLRTARTRSGRSFSGSNVPLLLGVSGPDGETRNIQISLR